MKGRNQCLKGKEKGGKCVVRPYADIYGEHYKGSGGCRYSKSAAVNYRSRCSSPQLFE